SLFPLSVFIALRVIKLPWLAAGFGALLATHISTDGLYGLDPPSFLWRGYGLSSQLFAMIWLPLAIAYIYRYFTQNTGLWLTSLFIILTAMGHLGLGMIAMLSLIPLAIVKPTKNQLTKLLLLSGTVIFFLSYWVIPIFLGDNYHNISFWDPPWKFASYGAKETIVRLLNGDLFDWGRGPWMSALVIVGLVAAAWPKHELRSMNYEVRENNRNNSRLPDSLFIIHNSYFAFSVLFIFWLLLYFGRTTWGGVIDLIPGMKEFHLSRFIVGVHAAGLFLVPIGAWWVVEMAAGLLTRVVRVSHALMSLIGLMSLMGLMLPPIYRQTISYATHNDRLIKQANDNHAKVKADEEALFAAIRSLPPGRVYAGRGGWWGKDFKVAETPYYMNLSTYGIPTVLWLPETWSPNSDVEQYFSEDQAKDYDLFGIRYVAAPAPRSLGEVEPPKQEPQKFWKLIKEAPTWKLYEVTNVGYFATGIRPAIVAVDKRSYGNVVRLWIQSDAHVKGLYPELTFMKNYPRPTGLPNFKMLDEATYVIPNGSKHNLFQEPPVYMPPGWELSNTTPAPEQSSVRGRPIIESESVDSDMIFKARVSVPDNCTECIVVLKQSFHPNWRVTIDGKPTDTFIVFPFYLATFVPAGTHDVVFSYEPNRLKITLLITELLLLTLFTINIIRKCFLTRHVSGK
ncbi:hypothetical protein HY032_00210, partial [Candidatus Gottesmanbacteria bacterium]|nr:hypothetical protein [Candidatus Gottesmanbacteria bacterium]